MRRSWILGLYALELAALCAWALCAWALEPREIPGVAAVFGTGAVLALAAIRWYAAVLPLFLFIVAHLGVGVWFSLGLLYLGVASSRLDPAVTLPWAGLALCLGVVFPSYVVVHAVRDVGA